MIFVWMFVFKHSLTPISKSNIYQEFSEVPFENSVEILKSSVSVGLPFFAKMAEESVTAVCEFACVTGWE